jgi:selina-4(15),7(11)-diene synthase
MHTLTESSPRLYVPPFWSPTPLAEHPAGAAELGGRSMAWMTDLRIWPDADHRDQLAAFELGRLGTLTTPRGLPDRMQLTADLYLWYHAFDDAAGDAQGDARPLAGLITLVVELCQVLNDPGSALVRDPFTAGLADICRRIAGIAEREQYAEWLAALQSYLIHEVSEASRREQNYVPSLVEYAIYCIDGRAAMSSMLLVPIICGYRVPDEQMARLRGFLRLTCLMAGCDNDLYSLPKEMDQAGHVSLPKIIARQAGCGLQEALSVAMAVRDLVMHEFVALGAELIATLPDAGGRFAEDLLSWIRGQLEWGLSSARFAHPLGERPREFAPAPNFAAPGAQEFADELLSAVGPRTTTGA